MIPKDCSRKATVANAQLEHRIRQAALLTSEESRGVRLSFEAEKVTLSGRAPETGEAEATCPVQWEGDPMDIGFNPAFLIDAMRVVDTDTVTIEMTESNKPAVLKAGSNFLYVLMPVDLG